MEADPVQQAMDEWLKGNHLKAKELLLKEAEAGNGHAAHNLGTLYITGGIGIEPNREEARRWYEVALATGFEEAVASDPTWFRNET